MVKYAFVALLIVALVSFLGPTQDPKHRDVPSFRGASQEARSLKAEVEQNGRSLKSEIKINEYTFRLFEDRSIGEESFEILQHGRQVYAGGGLGDHYFAATNLAGYETTGEGAPELIVERYSEGAPGCFSYDIFAFVPRFERVTHVDGPSCQFDKDLNEAVIKELFSARANDQSSEPDLDHIRWQTGSFTDAKAIEALASFYDGNECHACGWSEIWLLRFDGRWKVDRKLEDSDRVSFQLVDIEGDGKSEIWIEESGGNQGAFFSTGRLLSLDYASSTVMYANSGIDHYGAGAEGEAIRTHTVEFRDLDRDGILEILDLEQRKFYRWTGERHESDYVETGSASHMTVLKLEGGVFKEVDLPATFSETDDRIGVDAVESALN